MLLEDFVKKKINLKKDKLQYRFLQALEKGSATEIYEDGKKYISFSCNDYLGLSNNPDIKEAAISAIKKYGIGSGSSRLITGNHLLYRVLEKEIASLKKTEDSIVFGSGYLTNIGVISAFMTRKDLIVADKEVHSSIIDGIILSNAKLLRFKHNDLNDCDKLLRNNRESYNNCLILTDSVFSMDGSVAPVKELYQIALKYKSWLLTDEAHSTGVITDKEFNKNQGSEHIQTGTLSKAVGSYGGYVCATKKVTEYLTNYSRPLIYSTALPPSVIAASVASIKFIKNNKNFTLKPLENAVYFTSLLKIKQAVSPIVFIILKDEEKALNASKILKKEGFIVIAIRPPTVTKSSSGLRFTFSALHKKEDIKKLTDIIKKNDWV